MMTSRATQEYGTLKYGDCNGPIFIRVHCAVNNTRMSRRGIVVLRREDSTEKVCSDLPAKRCEGDCARLSQLLVFFLMQDVKVCKSGQLLATS